MKTIPQRVISIRTPAPLFHELEKVMEARKDERMSHTCRVLLRMGLEAYGDPKNEQEGDRA